MFHNSKTSKNEFTDENLKYSNLRPGFGFLSTWLLLVSQTVRQHNPWACIPSDSLDWKCVSSEPMEDELLMLVYSVSFSCILKNKASSTSGIIPAERNSEWISFRAAQ